MGAESRIVNIGRIVEYLDELMKQHPYDYVYGATSFESVFNILLPVQQNWLEQQCGERFQDLLVNGSFISVGVSYHDSVIDRIDSRMNGQTDFENWNIYADEYSSLNDILDDISNNLANRFDGISVPATLHDLARTIEHVTDYYGQTISHRVVAELAGLGWRGKNGLVINERFGCAVRFTSVATTLPLDFANKVPNSCGSCTACEDVCSFIKHRETLPDYRENCRRFIANLRKRGLKKDVCGKCIQACIREGIHASVFDLKP
jgi:epoxyqueuosine reductase